MLELFKTKYKSKIASTRGRVDKDGKPIDFLLTFEEYCKLWNDQGLLPTYPWCISRINDYGNYELDNVYISTSKRNSVESSSDDTTDHILTDFALFYKMKRSQVKRALKTGTLTMEFITEYLKGKSLLDTKYE